MLKVLSGFKMVLFTYIIKLISIGEILAGTHAIHKLVIKSTITPGFSQGFDGVWSGL
jgi:hypothetical protein